MGAFAVLGAALISAALPAPGAFPASSATPAPPVRIDQCKLDYVPANMHGFSLSEAVGPLHITFANTGTKPIAKISFRVVLAGRAFGVDDNGWFTPNVTIAHVFRDLNGTHRTGSPQPQPTCSVESLTYGDGTTASW
jgi:hypothetical protein